MLRLRHQKERMLLLFIATMLAILVGATACDTLRSPAPTAEPVCCKVTPVRISPSATPSVATQTPTSCDRPALPGTTVLVDEMGMLVNAVVRPADGLVATGASSNPSPAAGNVFVLVSLSVACRKSSDAFCPVAPPVHFRLQTAAGEVNPQAQVAGVPGLLSTLDIPGGETIYGGMVFEIDAEETDLVLTYRGDSGNTACLVVPAWTTSAAAMPPAQPTPTEPAATATPSPTATPEPTATPTFAPSATYTAPSSPLSTPTVTATLTPEPTTSLTPTLTPTVTITPTPTITSTPTTLLPASGRSVSMVGAFLVIGVVLVVGGCSIQALRHSSSG